MVDLDTNKPFKGFIGGWILLSDGRILGESYVTDIEERQLWDTIKTSPIVAGLLTENGAVETQNAIYILGRPDKGEKE
tara:strand:+ start:168 stop:401 length:234 start_codon:yes stop_codon:yes gene_type:complete